MRIDFTKMHGLGNDFLLMEVPAGGPLPNPTQWRQLADRHAGVGFDQALVLEPSRQAGSAAHYRVFNADGGEVEQCGNGARCIAYYLQMHGRAGVDGNVSIDGVGGTVSARVLADGRVTVLEILGSPTLRPAPCRLRRQLPRRPTRSRSAARIWNSGRCRWAIRTPCCG